MTQPGRFQIAVVSFGLACAALSSGVSAAELDGEVWREECAACHVAYPARFLPADSWREIMRTLEDHFGADASVDIAVAEQIRRYLESAARSPARSQPASPVLRITQTRWFLHEHDEISAERWRNPKVKSAANCAACHLEAEAGRFSEKSVRIPK